MTATATATSSPARTPAWNRRWPGYFKSSKANEEFNKVYQQHTEFMKEERTGFVWLYLQK